MYMTPFTPEALPGILHLENSHIITIVGAGGKTTLMTLLAQALSRGGKKVLLTTTTHIMRPDFLPASAIVESENKPELTEVFSRHSLVALGIPCEGKSEKWKAPSLDFLCEIQNIPDIILCEGDGSRRMPVKIPREGEPVFYPNTDTVLGILGLSALHQPVGQCLFGATEMPSISPEDILTPDFFSSIALSDQGLHKGIQEQKYRVVFNQADTLSSEDIPLVKTSADKIRGNGVYCLIASLNDLFFI